MKALLDSNVLIQFFRDPESRIRFDAKASRPLLYLSSVVVMELAAGCRSKKEELALAQFVKPFEKAGRMVTPDQGCWVEAGRVLAALAGDGIDKVRRRMLMNDLLIALSAQRAGAVVVTANASDFKLIAEYVGNRWTTP